MSRERKAWINNSDDEDDDDEDDDSGTAVGNKQVGSFPGNKYPAVMVNTGKPSTGCGNCRARHIKVRFV